MRSRTVPVLLAVSVALGACSTDETTDQSGTGPSTQPSPTTVPVDLADYLPSDDVACLYLSNVLAVAIEEGETREATIEQAMSYLGELEVTGSETTAAKVLGPSDPETPEASSAASFDEADTAEFSDAHQAIDQRLALLVIDADPMVTARALRASFEMRAAPVHAVGMVGHYKLAPGTDPTSSGTALSSVDADPQGPNFGYVAVVDSGIAASNNGSPTWLFGPQNLLYVASDIEPASTVPSHGTFVAGLIRQIAPTHAVSITSARAVDQSRITTSPENDVIEVEANLSTELHVYEAIERMIARHTALEAPADILNLSLGAYTCDLADDGTLRMAEDDTILTLATGIQVWYDTVGTDVFAAGGNETYEYNGTWVSFWPAALSTVTGVGAVNQEGMEVAWQRDPAGDMEVDASGARPWISVTTPGVDLLSLGTGGGDVYSWSGSSFATAVASAMSASGLSPGPAYTSVPNLAFVP
jgi:hypothetical protein